MNILELKKSFEDVALKYNSDNSSNSKLWLQIVEAYSESHRHYHTLEHLAYMHQQLFEVRSEIQNWDTVIFSLFYHDFKYNVLSKQNEEDSAKVAVDVMSSLNVPRAIIENCSLQIKATKSHNLSESSDTNYFVDADLAILGKDWDGYRLYAQQVRKEYSIYPDILYKPGRKKVLQHFLQMDRIFKTDYFFEKFEDQAKLNLQRELNSL
jgi:predicted metal-dependent HD superfamily phosphohydrolase